jgi:hypothetical protein
MRNRRGARHFGLTRDITGAYTALVASDQHTVVRVVTAVPFAVGAFELDAADSVTRRSG